MALNKDYDYLFKILLIGNSNVKKASLLSALFDAKFKELLLPAIGMDFKIRTYQIDDKIVKLQIWDTAGDEKSKAITQNSYKGAHGVFLVYDINDKQSFRDIEKWLVDVKKHANEGIQKGLIGLKSGPEQERQVSYEEGQGFADQIGVKFMEISPQRSTDFENILLAMAKEIKNRVGPADQESKNLSRSENASQKPSKCY